MALARAPRKTLCVCVCKFLAVKCTQFSLKQHTKECITVSTITVNKMYIKQSRLYGGNIPWFCFNSNAIFLMSLVL